MAPHHSVAQSGARAVAARRRPGADRGHAILGRRGHCTGHGKRSPSGRARLRRAGGIWRDQARRLLSDLSGAPMIWRNAEADNVRLMRLRTRVTVTELDHEDLGDRNKWTIDRARAR